MSAKMTCVVGVLTLAACATASPVISKLDASLKKFTPVPEVAALYIYRNESLRSAVPVAVEIDGKPFGSTAAKTYLYIELEPGKHTVTSKAENTDMLEINMEGGELYYIWQEVNAGVLSVRTKLHVVDAAQGKKGVRESQLVPP